MNEGIEERVNRFYNVIQREIANYFTQPKDKNEHLSYNRIKLFLQDLLDFLNCDGFYIFTKLQQGKDKMRYFQEPKLFSFCILPQQLNREFLLFCKQCTLLYSEIFDNIVCDIHFLLKIFSGIREYDEFYRRMIEICERVYLNKQKGGGVEAGVGVGGREIEKDIRCVIGRSDYMMNVNEKNLNEESSQKKEKSDCEIKQIEYNTISVAFGNLSSTLFEAHKNMIKQIYMEYFSYMDNEEEKKVCEILENKFQNDFLEGIITCMLKCHNAYLKKYKPLQGARKTMIIFVLHNEHMNSFDKDRTKYELNKRGINQKCFTIDELQILFEKKKLFLNYSYESLSDSLKRVRANQGNDPSQWKFEPGKLILDLNTEAVEKPVKEETEEDLNLSDYHTNYNRNVFEVSVVYFRSLYSPDHFNETIWLLRELLEFSDAVKVPSLPYQLVGSKRIQMLLLDNDILKKYISLDLHKMQKTEEQICYDMNLLRKTFALQVDPSLEKNKNIVSKAIQREYHYLLKPQREGGKNNLHGQDVREKLMLFYKPEERQKLSFYVLMQRLFPPSFTTIHCRTKEHTNEEFFDNSSHLKVEERKREKVTQQGDISSLPCDKLPNCASSHEDNCCAGKYHLVEFSPEHSISEISLFHNFIFYENENILNEQKGYLVRTKNVKENEGGAICGISSLDSFFLV
ncbi:glutathione synthetase [Plasmodium gonderi]|uniref:Glutathione synthetase n=1 Tax=Plasmodium gonderi TaxID=77519 RepID=A0A1Y1JJ73_PLAGO|nr:glutathione synthetase [Plasmodium gonderi]GAW81435.1 glutathione synthetase [Plasmodium gonderi]